MLQATGQKIGNPHIPRKEAACNHEEFVGRVTDADIHDQDDAKVASGQTIDKIADDDPPVSKKNTKTDFSVKAPEVVAAEKKADKSEDGWEKPAAKQTARKRHAEGSKVFRTEAKSGGMATLRIVAT